MKVLDFGKYEGKILAMCPQPYILWLSRHEKVLAERNRWAALLAKKLLEKAQKPCEKQEERIVMIDHEMPFGKHRGKKLSQLPADYLQWMQDSDYNPNPIVKNGVNWSELAIQELRRRRQAKQQEIENAPAIFTLLPPGTYTGNIVKKLVPELVAHIKAGNDVELSEENIRRLMLKAGYASLPASNCPRTIIWAAKGALEGKRPGGVSNDMEMDLWNHMDEQGNLCEEEQSQQQVYW